MRQSSRDIVQRAYDAFATGDMTTVEALLADDITFHVPGRSPLSAHYTGRDDVLAFFAKAAELSDGTLHVTPHEILSDGERVVALTTVTAQRNGASGSFSDLHVIRVIDERIVEIREYQGDQQSQDEFWAA